MLRRREKKSNRNAGSGVVALGWNENEVRGNIFANIANQNHIFMPFWVKQTKHTTNTNGMEDS